MMIISIDLGTTHTKAGLFNSNWDLVKFARTPLPTHQNSSGFVHYDPEEMWSGVINILREIIKGIDSSEVSAIGVSSMAETGLLVDKQSGQVKSDMLPWHDRRSISHVSELAHDRDPYHQFTRSGIRPNFKCSLSKLLWIRDSNPAWLAGTTWLSTADYIAFQLTGCMATDYSLAGRTYAFRIDELSWDEEWLRRLGLPADIFPPARSSGRPVGELNRRTSRLIGLPAGIPVCICGHDHVCAAFAAIGTDTSLAFDSMGTAEALVGRLLQDKLGQKEYASGLVFGRYVAENGYYWMGGMSSSGGSLDWLRKILADPALSYQELDQLLDNLSPEPGGVIYLPYLAGSGSPHTDVHARGAFIGLDHSHHRSALIKAVLEGTAYEAEYIRQAAGSIMQRRISSLVAAGGGSKIRQWMQIKADISGCLIEVPAIKEATLLGAAILAGTGSGIIDNGDALNSSYLADLPGTRYTPHEARHKKYQKIYQDAFLALQEPLRQVSKRLFSTSGSPEG